MRLVHLSDLHLGYRQYQRLTPGGINQREADVAATFRAAIDRIIELAPDVVIVAGDVFHTVRPTNQAILHAFIQFSRLTASLPGTRILMVAGNHDTPRSAATGSILRLVSQLGIDVVEGGSNWIRVDELDLAVLAVPDMARDKPRFERDTTAKYNILMLHGEIEDVLPNWGRELERSPMKVTLNEIRLGQWDYVAL